MSKLAHSNEETMEKIERQNRMRNWFINDDGCEVGAGSVKACPQCGGLSWYLRPTPPECSACSDCGHMEG